MGRPQWTDVIAEKLDAYDNIRPMHGNNDPVTANNKKNSFRQGTYRKRN